MLGVDFVANIVFYYAALISTARDILHRWRIIIHFEGRFSFVFEAFVGSVDLADCNSPEQLNF
jgi:hypothetical protein